MSSALFRCYRNKKWGVASERQPIDIKTIFDSELQTDLFDREGEAVVMLLLVAYKGCVAALLYDCLTLF